MPIFKKWVSAEDKAHHMIVAALESGGFFVGEEAEDRAAALATLVGNDPRSESGWESETIGMDAPQPPASAQPVTKSHWDDNADYPVKDWQYEVANGDTRLGYAEWVLHKIESALPGEPEKPAEPEEPNPREFRFGCGDLCFSVAASTVSAAWQQAEQFVGDLVDGFDADCCEGPKVFNVRVYPALERGLELLDVTDDSDAVL